jgi:hypothetical protein
MASLTFTMLTLLGAGTNRGSTSIMTIERELGEEIFEDSRNEIDTKGVCPCQSLYPPAPGMLALHS